MIAAATALLAVGPVPVTLGVLAPYKADVRGLFDELAALQERQLEDRVLVAPLREPDRCEPVPLHGWVVVTCT